MDSADLQKILDSIEVDDVLIFKETVGILISDATKGKEKSIQTKENMSRAAKLRDNNQLGLKRDQYTKDKISAKKMERTPEERQAQARLGGLTHKGKPKPKYECPHCKKMIAANMFDRYHNNNCKLKDS